MRRLPPGPEDVKNNLEGLLDLAPGCSEELLQRVDQVRMRDRGVRTCGDVWCLSIGGDCLGTFQLFSKFIRLLCR